MSKILERLTEARWPTSRLTRSRLTAPLFESMRKRGRKVFQPSLSHLEPRERLGRFAPGSVVWIWEPGRHWHGRDGILLVEHMGDLLVKKVLIGDFVLEERSGRRFLLSQEECDVMDIMDR